MRVGIAGRWRLADVGPFSSLLRVRRASMLGRVVLLIAVVMFLSPTASAAQAQSTGVPSSADEATISRHVDGDKVTVTINGEEEEVLLAGIDAPEKGECFANESS